MLHAAECAYICPRAKTVARVYNCFSAVPLCHCSFNQMQRLIAANKSGACLFVSSDVLLRASVSLVFSFTLFCQSRSLCSAHLVHSVLFISFRWRTPPSSTRRLAQRSSLRTRQFQAFTPFQQCPPEPRAAPRETTQRRRRTLSRRVGMTVHERHSAGCTQGCFHRRPRKTPLRLFASTRASLGPPALDWT